MHNNAAWIIVCMQSYYSASFGMAQDTVSTHKE